MLSVRTNNVAISAVRSLERATDLSATASAKLATGYRINAAMDDAAGLQIATRLRAQASGLAVAMRNMQNTTSILQTADAAVGGVLNVVGRMKDLATQAADGATTTQDKAALQDEFDALFDQYVNLWTTTYAGQRLFTGSSTDYLDGTVVVNEAKFDKPMQVQVGDSASDRVTLDLRSANWAAGGSIGADIWLYHDSVLTDDASQTIEDLASMIDSWSVLRSAIGASANMLEHAQANASSMLAHTQAASGRITDTDYATVTAESTQAQMLAQSSVSMLKQSGSSVQLVLSLIQS